MRLASHWKWVEEGQQFFSFYISAKLAETLNSLEEAHDKECINSLHLHQYATPCTKGNQILNGRHYLPFWIFPVIWTEKRNQRHHLHSHSNIVYSGSHDLFSLNYSRTPPSEMKILKKRKSSLTFFLTLTRPRKKWKSCGCFPTFFFIWPYLPGLPRKCWKG